MIDWNTISLKKVLILERQQYVKSNCEYVLRSLLNAERSAIWKFQKNLRKAEYYKWKKRVLMYAIYLRRKNRIGNKLGLAIPCGVFDVGLHICHIGCIVVNGSAQVGQHCTLHGNNCIGNDGRNNENVPLVGDNVEFGFGSSAFGKVKIARNTFIKAGVIVTKDIINDIDGDISTAF